MKFKSSLFLLALAVVPFSSHAQAWKWAKENTFSTSEPFQESFLQAVGAGGAVYTFLSTGSQSTTPALGGVITHCGSVDAIDSFNCVQGILTKTDSGGAGVWTVSSQGSDVGCTAITTDNAGNIYITGVYDSARMRIGGVSLSNPNTPKYETFIAKVNSAGSVVWAKNIANCTPDGMDDMRFGQGGIGVDAVGNVFVTGTYVLGPVTIGSYTLASTGFLDNDLYLAKFDSLGNLDWARGYGSVSGYFLGNNINVSQQGAVYISGQYITSSFAFGSFTLSSISGYGMFLARLDSSGTPLWAKNFPCTMNDFVNGMTMDRDRNIYITGMYTNGAIIFGADTLINVAGGASDLFLAKYDTAGNELWARTAGGNSGDQGYSVAADSFGNVWVAGTMSNGFYSAGYVMGFGGVSDTLSAPAGSSDPLFIARYNQDGAYLSSMAITSGGDDQCNIMVDNYANFYITGDWWNAGGTFGTDVLGYTGGSEKAFTARYNYSPLLLPLTTPTPVAPSRAGIYPNPANHECTVTLPGNGGQATASLYDPTGRLQRTYQLIGENTLISLQGLPPGVYFCKVQLADATVQTLKLVVQ